MSEWNLVDTEPTHRGNLSVRPSATSGHGLYTLEPIDKDGAIGVWTGSVFDEGEWESDRYGLEVRYEESTVVITPVENGAVNFTHHPLAALNEPPVGADANVYMRVEDYDDDNGAVHLMTVFYAAVKIEAGQELWWHYGPSYKRDYEVGSACSAVGNPPYNYPRFYRVLQHRPDGLYSPPSDTSSNDASE